MSEKSILEMVGGEKHINPHYNIKAEKIGSYWKKDKSKMTEEQIKQKAEEKANKVIIGSGMDRASVIHLKHLLTTFYIQGYHTGAEPREKQITDLEKENERLTDELKTLRESIKDYGAGCYENGLRNGKRKLEAQIADLEKENAELKEKVNILDNCDRLGDMITEAYKDQLTKATEIIKKLYAVYYDPCVTESDLKYRDELFAEIKQFLKNDGCLDVMCEDCTKEDCEIRQLGLVEVE